MPKSFSPEQEFFIRNCKEYWIVNILERTHHNPTDVLTRSNEIAAVIKLTPREIFELQRANLWTYQHVIQQLLAKREETKSFS